MSHLTPVPPPDDHLPVKPVVWVRASPDGCPNCLRRRNGPELLIADMTTGAMRAFYSCPNCHHSWTTSWALELLEAS